MKLAGKVAVVTGSAANIGKATASLFAREGAKVVVTTKSNVQAGQDTANEIKQAGGEVVFVKADLSKPDEVAALFNKAQETYGTVDILVNNAGAPHAKPFMETTRADWVAAFDDNIFSMVLCSQAAVKIMLDKREGVILNTTSVRGIEHTGREGIMAYSAAKAAAINFTKTLAKELAPHIRVNAVAPGFVHTPHYDTRPKEANDEFLASTLTKKWLNSRDIAEAFLYLATAEGVTGEQIVVDAGFTLK